MSRWPFLSMCAALLTFAGCSDGPAGFAAANVVLISIDTLRADHLSLYGYHRPTSPFLDELASEAVVFDNVVINGGYTLPSHMTMMTSLNAEVHGIRPREQERLPDARTTLAEVLKSGGYRTAGFVDAGWVRGKFGFAQGFDVYDDAGGRFEAILPKAYAWLAEEHLERFFLFLHTFDVHSQWDRLPYECPAGYPNLYSRDYETTFDGCRDGKCASRLFRWIAHEVLDGRLDATDVLTREEVEFSAALYDGCINYVDDRIREVVERLRSHGVLDRTLLVITSDHGEEFLDHGGLLHAQRGFEELVRIPLIVRFPNGDLGGRRVQHLAAMVDLMPTILEVVGLPSPAEVQGRSLMPAVVRGRRVRSNATIREVLRTERWKLIPRAGLLFDLRADPREQENLWDREPDTVLRLRRQLEQQMELDRKLAATLDTTDDETGRADLTEEEIRELRALGYLD